LDDDCDPATAPLPQLCVQVTRTDTTVTDCRIGEQLCNDTHPGGGFGTCNAAPIDTATNQERCSAWADCVASGQAPDCLCDSKIKCKLGVGNGAPCLPATYPLGTLVSSTTCTWEVIGNIQQGPWDLGLRPSADPNAPLSTFSDVCDADLVVDAADLVPRVF